MKKNNRFRTLCAALAILFFTVALLVCLKSCADKRSTEQMIADFNKHATLPFGLAVLEEELGDISEYEYLGGFGCYRLEKEDISYEIGGFPDVVDNYRTTAVHFTSSAYAIYDIRIGDAYTEEIADKMMELDFMKAETTNPERYIRFENDELSIHFTLENGIITEISARLESTNKNHVVF